MPAIFSAGGDLCDGCRERLESRTFGIGPGQPCGAADPHCQSGPGHHPTLSASPGSPTTIQPVQARPQPASQSSLAHNQPASPASPTTSQPARVCQTADNRELELVLTLDGLRLRRPSDGAELNCLSVQGSQRPCIRGSRPASCRPPTVAGPLGRSAGRLVSWLVCRSVARSLGRSVGR